jgi:hypothetical protein
LSEGQELITNWLIGYLTKVTCYKGKGKVFPRTGQEDPEGEWRYSSTLSLSRVVIGLLTGHNTLRLHLYVTGLSDNPIRRKCVTEEETSVHVFCAYEGLASLRRSYLSSFLDPEDIRKLNIGAIWNFATGTALLYLVIEYGAHRACPSA